MAVFTEVSLAAFNGWAAPRYGGAASAITPISEGIENTNYRVHREDGDYVFTIFELWDAAAVAYYAALMQHLHAAALPVPPPCTAADGSNLQDWQGKPAVLVPFVRGEWLAAPQAAHCEAMGALLAQLHRAAAAFTPCRPNPRNGDWRREAAGKVRPHLSAALQHLLDDAIAEDAHWSAAPLPAAACHCDLFRNNVLWHNGQIAAVIDFYFGGEDSLIFDLAVCACDWCYDEAQDAFNDALLAALIRGYSSQRRLCELEKQLFPAALGSAATRFWLSRQYDLLFPRAARQLTPHDPQKFERILHTTRRAREVLSQVLLRAAA